jgi:hypothetical protein
MTATYLTAPVDGRRSGPHWRALGAALALCAPLAACGFGGDGANCVYGEAVDACASRLLGDEAGVAEADAFFARRGFAKDPRLTQAGGGALHVYARDEARGARTVFMVASFDEGGRLLGLQSSTRRN